jgi:Reverse transcriptase (RNA-dependent DNA polymerase)
VDTLLSITLHGTRIGFEGKPSRRVRRQNHSTAFVHPRTISESIQKEVEKGRVKEVASLPINSFCSPIGLVPKSSNGVQTGWRVIFDLSSPEGLSVNDGIPKHYGTIAYESLNDAICLVVQAGKGAVMMKHDLKAAFRHVPINPCDYWLLMFEWDGKFYVDMFLPFGLRTAPRIFNLFAEALHWVFETLLEWNCTHYLDDFLFVFPPGTDITHFSADFDIVLKKFGLSKAAEKDSNGCMVVHLGFEFDSMQMQVRLPQHKKQRALDSVNALLSASSILLTDLESTLGFLSHCCQVVPLGRPFLRNLFSLLCRHGNRRPSSKTRLSSDARNDLRWWHRFLTSWSSISLIRTSRRFFDVATDASGGKGIGGVYRRLVFSERIPSRHKLQLIDWKELFAILHAFLLWHDDWQGGMVRLACDNSGCGCNQQAFNTRTGNPPPPTIIPHCGGL